MDEVKPAESGRFGSSICRADGDAVPEFNAVKVTQEEIILLIYAYKRSQSFSEGVEILREIMAALTAADVPKA